MPYLLYLSNLPAEITLDDLIIYFQSRKSGGGDVNSEACKWDGQNAVVAFEEQEYLENVLVKTHIIKEHKLEISDKPFRPKPVPKKRRSTVASKKEEKTKTDSERAYLGEVRTVIVSGLSPKTTDETVQLFFENERRSGGGEIESMERCQPDVAHITYGSAEVAARVLKNVKLELEGYLLQIKEKQPKLFLPKERKKLYLENINPNTTKDSLMNYMEVRTHQEVCDLHFGKNGNALVIFNEEPDMNKLMENEKRLEGAVLKISNPPVCNSILVTGLTKSTTKDAIEMYFENEKNGGGKIYGDIIYQKDKGKAVVSFCDPEVLKALITREHKLNESSLSVREHYQFMDTITETTYSAIKLNSDVLGHVLKKCEGEIGTRFGASILEIFREGKEEVQFPETKAKEVEEYMKQFAVKEIPFCKKLLDMSRDELKMMVGMASKENITTTIEEDLLQIKIVGTKKCATEISEHFKDKISEMEKRLDVVHETLNLPENKLVLYSLHGVDKMFKDKFNVVVKIIPWKQTLMIEGPKEKVDLATKEAYQKCIKTTEDNFDLDETEKRFLEQGGLDVLNQELKAIGLKGMITLNESKTSKAKILAFEDATIKDVHSFLSRNMFVKRYSLDEDSLTLLKSNKWEEFCEKSIAETLIKINVDKKQSAAEISLVGKKAEVEKAYETLKDFMKRNTIVKESVDLDEGYVGYLMQYCTKHLEDIESEFGEHSVRMDLIELEGTVNIHGTKDGVKQARKCLEDIISNIATGKICFDRLRHQKYLESDEGKLSIEGIQSKHKCLIRLIKDDGKQSTIIPSSGPKEPSKLLCRYETQEKILLLVLKDNIEAHSCDVMVNAANGNLKHVGGVAGSILDAGGKEIQDECDAFIKEEGSLFDGEYFSGSPGKLPCKRLIHAVAPRWDSSKGQKICKLLKFTCLSVLKEAMNYRSIALPAIGSGIFGIPKESCVEIMIQAAEEFSQENPNCALKEIRFVNNDDVTCQIFLKKFREKFGGRSSLIDNQAKNNAGRRFGSSVSRSQNKKSEPEKLKTADEVQPRRIPGDFIITKKELKISVVVGDLSTYKADVVVNTTGENLQLDSNPCSKALSNEAGPTLQAECTKIGKLQVGEVKETPGGNLLCDEVYHVVCVQWNGGQGEQVLRSIVKNCLNKCNSSEKKSIAFPAIGTGILGFPYDVAAKIFFEETKEFEKSVTSVNIKEVSFVVYNQDAKSIEAFKNELKKQAEWGKGGLAASVPVASAKKRKPKRILTSTITKDDSSPSFDVSPEVAGNGVMCIQVGEEKEVEIVKGDITKETTDVIAHLTNSDLKMRGGVARALANAGGDEIQRECQDKVESAKPQVSTTVLTTAGSLDAKFVGHMVGSDYPSSNEIEKCINNCLKTASENECESVSLPAVGTGSLKHDPQKSATTIFTSVIRFFESSSGPLKLVRIIVKDDDLLAEFQTLAKKLNDNEEPGMLKRFANFFLKSDSATISVRKKQSVVRQKLFLEIYAKDEATVNRAAERITKHMESQNKREMLEDDNVGKLSKQQITEIEYLCEMNDVKVTVRKEVGRIFVAGHSDDISKTIAEIFKFLKKIGETEKEKEKAALHAALAEIVSQGVQWYYVDTKTGDQEEYDKQTNAIIEKAYNKNEKSVIFVLDDERCEIVFDTMQETNLVTNDIIKVIRKDLKAEVAVPEYWAPQPRDANGKEVAVHLVLLDPNDTSHRDEYKKVSDLFLKTAQQNILQIERVQNPTLFKQYMLKKKSLDEKSSSNEMMLFHGTKGDKLKEINESGLNRNYAGINGTAHGKGVYFARDASMSVGYAQKDKTAAKWNIDFVIIFHPGHKHSIEKYLPI